MKCIIQRVKSASVNVDNKIVAQIEKGLLVYVGFVSGDTEKDVDLLLDRIEKIRIFEDEAGKLNLSMKDIGAEVLTVPNFTLYANAFTGRRPSFTTAMPFEEGKMLYDYLISKPLFDAQHGVFGADMKIDSICDGPINIIIESQGGKAKV